MSITDFPNGVSSYGIPILGGGPIVTTGNVFFVDDSGSDSYDGKSPERPMATLDAAIGLCTASQGDVIVVMPGHAETAATQVTCDIAGVRIIGLGIGRNRPTITAHASAVDCFNVTAANVSIENIRIIGAADCTALINIAATGDDFYGYNLSLEHGAAPLMAVTCSGDRFKFERCKWLGTAAGPDCGIDLEAHCTDWEVVDCVFDYAVSAGVDLAGIRSNVDAQPGGLVLRCQFIGITATAIDINSSDQAIGDGLVADCHAIACGAITAAAAWDLGGWGASNARVTDSAAAGGQALPSATPD